MKTITVFGSALAGPCTWSYREAEVLGRRLAESGFGVANGGYLGLMEASAKGARESQGHTVGVTCELWPVPANPWIVEEIRTATFFDRIRRLIELGDAYVVLPGGTGTLAELALAWEMMNKSALAATLGGRKPLLVMRSYWESVIRSVEQESTLLPVPVPKGPSWRVPGLDIVTFFDSVDEVMAHLSRYFGGLAQAARF